MQIDKPILFFDGVCGLCNFFIDKLLWADRNTDNLRFAPIQGETAKYVLPEKRLKDIDTMALWKDGKLYYKSEGIIRGLASAKWYLSWTKVFLAIPQSWRDSLYDGIAQNRYKWFGKKETCRMPSEEDRGKVLP